MSTRIVLEPLDIKCTTTDCENGLHCFRQKRRMAGHVVGGQCRECGADLIDWPRVHQRELRDAEHTFRQLRFETIRHCYWHCAIDQWAINHARRKGRRGLFDDIRVRVAQSVGRPNHPREGRQTPKQKNLIYYGQHATASCCRACAEYWHGIPADRILTDEEQEYLSRLIELYIDERFHDLAERGVYVPPMRQRGRM